MDEQRKFTLYGRAYCHLCADMSAELERLQDELGIVVFHVDIDCDPVLAERYNDFVPVLMHQEREVARYRLNVEAFRAYLIEIR